MKPRDQFSKHRGASVWALSIFALLAGVLAGCEEGGVGDPCVPEDEYRAAFAGYAKEEVNVESRSFQCETRICLVNNFRGRVSCPLGQPDPNPDETDAEAVAALQADDRRCMLPDFSGQVDVAVPAQLVNRDPDEAVYCSCRCNGPASSKAPFCECPSGFSCKPLIDDLGLGKKELVGSYCVRDGTYVDDPLKIQGSTCNDSPDDCKGREVF